MALERDDHGRFRRPAEYDSAEFRADLLLLARLDAERALTQPVPPGPKRTPRPRALVLPRPRYREGLAAVFESNEHVQLERARTSAPD